MSTVFGHESNAYKYAGFGTHEMVVYYDLVRYLLEGCFELQEPNVETLEKLKDVWLNATNRDYPAHVPSQIIEMERKRINVTALAHELLIDEDCELCQVMLEEFGTPTFLHLDGSNMDYCFEFSFSVHAKNVMKNKANGKSLIKRERQRTSRLMNR